MMLDPEVMAKLMRLSDAQWKHLLGRCCSSTAWVQRMLAERPFHDASGIHQAADRAFDDLSDSDWLEAFAGHPKIGDVAQLRIKFGGDKRWSQAEQSQVAIADEATLAGLAQSNRQYEATFGFIFIVCATGKSAAEMLELLTQRLRNDRETEIRNASIHQRQITHLRIDKLPTDELLA